MSTQQTNRLNVVMTTAQITAVKTALQTIATNMPFLLGLTIDERISMPKINVSNKNFTEDALVAVQNNANLFPSYINGANLQNDLTLFNQLDELCTLARQLVEKMEDTQMLAGSEAFLTALSGFQMIKAAAVAGVPGTDTIAQQLAERFKSQGNTNGETQQNSTS